MLIDRELRRPHHLVGPKNPRRRGGLEDRHLFAVIDVAQALVLENRQRVEALALREFDDGPEQLLGRNRAPASSGAD